MGKRYYCDYCDKTMSCAPSIIRTHNNGLLHERAKQDHFQKFKDAETILKEEQTKKPCGKFPFGQCQFGSICRFSHYSQEELQYLRNYVAMKNQTDKMTTQPSFQELYNNLQTEKESRDDGNTVLVDTNGVAHTLPWNYSDALTKYGNSLPPSVKPISIEDFSDITISEWG